MSTKNSDCIEEKILLRDAVDHDVDYSAEPPTLVVCWLEEFVGRTPRGGLPDA